MFLESGDDGEAEEGFVVTGEWTFCAFSYFCLGGCCLLYVEKAIMIVRKARKPKGTKETVWNGHEWGVWMRKEWPVAGLASCKSATYLLAREELVDDQWERDK